MSSYGEYATLVGRCGAWSVEDLGDLLHEIQRDRDLRDPQRTELQQRVYRLLWDRVERTTVGRRPRPDTTGG